MAQGLAQEYDCRTKARVKKLANYPLWWIDVLPINLNKVEHISKNLPKNARDGITLVVKLYI